MDGPEDMSGNTVEFRRNGLVHVDTALLRSMPYTGSNVGGSRGKAASALTDLALPEDRTEPIGLCFADGNIMLLWARAGKDFKVWSRALKRFVS